MTSQKPAQSWEDDGGAGDLRAFVDVVFRYRLMILALVVAVMAVTAAVNYLMLKPRFHSSVVVTLPSADGTGGLGLNALSYRQFATDAAVTKAVYESTASNPAPVPKGGSLSASVETGPRLLTVTGSAQTADDAYALASRWADAFEQQTLALLKTQLSAQKQTTENAVKELLARLNEREDALAKFDQENGVAVSDLRASTVAGTVKKPVTLAEVRLSGLQAELVGREQRQRELGQITIPTDEARAAFLEQALAKEPQTLGNASGGVVLPGQGSGAGVPASEVTILNPVYLQLSQDLALTRARLAASKRESEILRAEVATLQTEVDRQSRALVTVMSARDRLDREVAEIRVAYNPALTQLDRLVDTERRLAQMARVERLSAAGRPDAPTSPKKLNNIIISGALTAMGSVVLAIVLSWYRSGGPTAGQVGSEQQEGSPAGG